MTPTQTDSRTNLIEKIHGHTGYFVVHKLLQFTYGEEGYFLHWNERLMRMYCADWRVDQAAFQAILEDCLAENIYDRAMLEQHGILTSAQIQENYFSVVYRRKSVRYEEKYLLIDVSAILKLQENSQEKNPVKAESQPEHVEMNSPSVDMNDLSVNIFTTRKQASEAKQVRASEAQKGKAREGKKGNFLNSKTEFSSKEVDQRSGLDGKKMNESFNQERAENEEFTPNEATHTEGGREKNQPVQDADNQKVKAGNASQSGKKSEDTKKRPPHPVRPQVIGIWEQKFGQIYTNNFDGNIGIAHIIKSLENLIRHSEPDLTEIQLHTKIADLWSMIMFSWGKIDPFLAKQIQFDQIGKNIVNIINQLKINGTASSNTSNNQSNKPNLSQVKSMLRASFGAQ